MSSSTGRWPLIPGTVRIGKILGRNRLPRTTLVKARRPSESKGLQRLRGKTRRGVPVGDLSRPARQETPPAIRLPWADLLGEFITCRLVADAGIVGRA